MRADNYLPQWTEPASAEEGGRDPLGLARVHDRITEWLVPGITTQTHRARYYSYYLWAVGDVNAIDAPGRRHEFEEGMRRREAGFVLACLADHDGDGPAALVGVRQGERRWRSQFQSGSFRTDFQPLPSMLAGGYGQYYGGSLYNLGLVHTPVEANGVDRLTPLGQTIAAAFSVAVADTEYIKEGMQGLPELGLATAQDYGKHACLCRLRSATKADLGPLTDLFFGMGEHNRPEAVPRRETLLLCLDAVSAANKHKIEVAKGAFDALVVSCCAFYGHLLRGKRSVRYGAPKPLTTCAQRWRWLELHRYTSYALERLLSALLTRLNDAQKRMSLDEFVRDLDWGKMSQTAREFAPGLRGADLRGWVGAVLGSGGAISEQGSLQFDRSHGLSADLSEDGLGSQLAESDDLNEQVALSVLLLLTLYCRFNHCRGRDPRWMENAQRGDGELWFEVVARRIDDHLSKKANVAQFLVDLLDRDVLDGHERMRFERGKLDASWLERDGAMLTWQRDYRPPWRSSKMENCGTILEDLGLLHVDEDGLVEVAPRGAALRSRLLAEMGEG